MKANLRVLLACICILLLITPLAQAAGKLGDRTIDTSGIQESIRENADAARAERVVARKLILTIGISTTGALYEGMDAELIGEIFESLGYSTEEWLYTAMQVSETKDEETLLIVMDTKVYRIRMYDEGMIEALASGEIDLVAGDASLFMDEELYRTGAYYTSDDNREFVLAGRDGSQSIIEDANTKINNLYASGVFADIEAQYVSTSFWQRCASTLKRFWNRIATEFNRNLIREQRYKMLLSGLGTTLKISLTACVMGVVIGVMIALMRLSSFKFLRGISTLYVNVVRGTPVVVQLMIIYYIVLAAPSKVFAAMVTFSVNSGAYVSEMVRGGILSVDRGQTEAGLSLGLSKAATMLKIVLPQTVKIILPSLFNEFVTLLKETSVVGFIGLMDLSKAGDFIRSRTYSAFFPLIAVALIYLVLVTILTKFFAGIERRLRASDNR